MGKKQIEGAIGLGRITRYNITQSNQVSTQHCFTWVIRPQIHYKKWNGKPRLAFVNVRHPPSKNPIGVLSWTCRSQWKWQRRQTGGQSNHHRRLASQKIRSVEELETLPAGTKPRISHHRSPGGERRRKKKRSMIFLERTWKGHRQSVQHWNGFQGNIGETPERRGGAHMDRQIDS